MWNTDKWIEVKYRNMWWVTGLQSDARTRLLEKHNIKKYQRNIDLIVLFHLSISWFNGTGVSEDLGTLLGLHLGVTSLAVESILAHQHCRGLQLLCAGATFEAPFMVPLTTFIWDWIKRILYTFSRTPCKSYLLEIPQHHRHVSHTWDTPPVPEPPSSCECPVSLLTPWCLRSHWHLLAPDILQIPLLTSPWQYSSCSRVILRESWNVTARNIKMPQYISIFLQTIQKWS